MLWQRELQLATREFSLTYVKTVYNVFPAYKLTGFAGRVISICSNADDLE